MNSVAARTTEIGQRTWGVMRGVMALASQKVEAYTKEGTGWTEADTSQGMRQENSSSTTNNNKGGNWNSNSVQQQYHSNNAAKAADDDNWGSWQYDEDKGVAHNKNGGDHSDDKDGWAGWDDTNDDEHEAGAHKSTGKRFNHSYN